MGQLPINPEGGLFGSLRKGRLEGGKVQSLPSRSPVFDVIDDRRSLGPLSAPFELDRVSLARVALLARYLGLPFS